MYRNYLKRFVLTTSRTQSICLSAVPCHRILSSQNVKLPQLPVLRGHHDSHFSSSSIHPLRLSCQLCSDNRCAKRLNSALLRHFSISTAPNGRHWYDTLKDDDDLDKRFNDPLYSKGATNPKPYELELDMKAYRLEQEEKYRSFRPLLVFYVIAGSICGYVACDSFRESKKAQRKTQWMTPKAGDKLKPFIWATSATALIYVIEFCEACGSLGAHVPFYTIGSFAVVFFAKYIYREVQDFLE